MDDLFEPKTPEAQRQAQAEFNWHREQARKAHDIIRITNPLNITVKGQPFELPIQERQHLSPQFMSNGDYMVDWDGLRYRIPLNGNLEIDRYIAQKYCREMCTAIINYFGEVAGKQLLDREGKNRPEVLLDKYLENEAVWNKVPRTDDTKLMAEIWPQLWVGLVRENGLDSLETSNQVETDFRTDEEKLMASLATKRVSDIQADLEPVLDPQTPVDPPLYISKATRAAMAKEVTSED